MKILIVDDNEELCTLLSDYFALHNDKCIIANSCRNGLSAIHTTRFDVVLCDIGLPDCDEACFIDNLENEGQLEKNNIVILTEKNFSDSEIKLFLKRGVREFLKKPINPDVLYSISQQVSKNQD